MSITGLVGAVYVDDAAPIHDNVALLFDWTLEVLHNKGHTYGPELHGVPSGWTVTAEAYWAGKRVGGLAFIRLFIGGNEDLRCLAGPVQTPTPMLGETEGVCKARIRLEGIGVAPDAPRE